jgi:hypothetical protein
MRDSHDLARISARCTHSSGIVVRLFSLMLLAWATVVCQSTYSQTTNVQEKPVKHYALVFYASRALTPEELKQRQIEILEWAKDVTSMGINLDPRAFAAPLARLFPSGGEAVSDKERTGATFSNIVFFDSASEEQALRVAQTHPGLRYGTTIEVREWTSPRAATTP